MCVVAREKLKRKVGMTLHVVCTRPVVAQGWPDPGKKEGGG